MGLLDGKVIMVTGGGRGVGRAHALALAAEGAKIVVNDIGAEIDGHGRDGSVAELVAEEIRTAGGTAIANTDDISDWDAAHKIVHAGIQEFGRLDGVLNNAGNVRGADLADLKANDLDAMIKVHVNGTFACSAHACAYWRNRYERDARSSGAIVNTISDFMLISQPGYSVYAAVKGAITGLTTTGSREGRHYGVRINAYGPRGRTRLTAGGPLPTDGAAHPKDPGNCSPLVAWLLSDQSAHVTGQVFQTLGGGIARCSPWTPEKMIWPPKGAFSFPMTEVGHAVNSLIFNSAFPDMTAAEPPENGGAWVSG